MDARTILRRHGVTANPIEGARSISKAFQRRLMTAMMRAHAETEGAVTQSAAWTGGSASNDFRSEYRGERRDAEDHHHVIRAVRDRVGGATSEPAFAAEPEPEPAPDAAFAADPEAAPEDAFGDLLADTTGDVIIRLWKYWDTVRRDNRYPILGAHTASLCNRFADSIVILDVKKSPEDPLLSYVGQDFRDDARRAGPFARDPVGGLVSEVPETALLAKLVKQYPEVVADGSPVAATIEAEDRSRTFNVILLPFGTDGTRLDAILGIGVPDEKFGGETSRDGDAVAPAPDFGAETNVLAAADILADADGLPETDAFPKAGVIAEADILTGGGDSAAPISNDLAASLEECRALAREFDAASTRSKETLYNALQKAYGFSFQAEGRS